MRQTKQKKQHRTLQGKIGFKIQTIRWMIDWHKHRHTTRSSTLSLEILPRSWMRLKYLLRISNNNMKSWAALKTRIGNNANVPQQKRWPTEDDTQYEKRIKDRCTLIRRARARHRQIVSQKGVDTWTNSFQCKCWANVCMLPTKENISYQQLCSSKAKATSTKLPDKIRSLIWKHNTEKQINGTTKQTGNKFKRQEY